MNIGAIEVIQWVVYFASLYFSVFWLLVYLEESPKRRKKKYASWPKVTITVPAYNEENTIAKTLDSILNIDYPLNRLEVLVMNDGSTDKTKERVQPYLKHKHITLVNQKNGGKGNALNNAIRRAKGEFFVCLDADSEVAPDSLKILLGEFTRKDIAAVVPAMKIKNSYKLNLLQKFQWYEYLINVFFKKIMGKLDCIHVAPGPFSVYKKQALIDVGYFHESDLTEDLEMTIRLQANNYKIIQNMEAEVYTNAMPTLKKFLNQRNRWFKGGVFNAVRYRHMMFRKNWGDFGMIQLPILIASGVISLVIIGSLLYSTLKPLIENIFKLNLVSFDIITMLQNFTFNFVYTDLSAANIVLVAIMLGLSVSFLGLATYYTKEKLFTYNPIIVVTYLFLYFFILALTWVFVLKDLVTGRVQKW